MKKKLVVLFVLLCFICNSIFGYEDYYNNEVAQAFYAGTSDTLNVDNFISNLRKGLVEYFKNNTRLNYYPNIQKLTKRQSQLIEIALNEYSIKPKEIYYVVVYTGQSIVVVVEIKSVSKDGSYSYNWLGI
ncbi:MAG: hypothetical protein IKK38_12240 [Spirochaetaceae bacterium]|nr:hypothetical protein [Spirochaetaceae bacterium]